MIRRTVHYSGRVQGIGFRAGTASIARKHDVAGTVENLPDGRVRLVAQGGAEEVKSFLDAVDRELGRNVRGVESSEDPPDADLPEPEALHAFRILR